MSPLRYLRYAAVAFQPGPLLLELIFAAGLAFASFAGLFGVPLSLILVSWASKYAFVCLDAVSRGLREAPVLSIEMVNPASEQRPLGMLLIAGVYYAATAALAPHVPAALIVTLRGLGLLLFPASLLTLAVTGQIVEAVNPRTLVDVIRRLGFDYAVLTALIAGFVLGVRALASLDLWLAANLALSLVGWMSMFCVMGGLLYERRHELGLDAWHSPEREAARQDRERAREFDRELDELYVHCRVGDYDKAWAALERTLATREYAFDSYREFYSRLVRWPDARLADRLARDFKQRHGERAERVIEYTKGRAPASK